MSTLKFQNKISHRAIKSSFIFAILPFIENKRRKKSLQEVQSTTSLTWMWIMIKARPFWGLFLRKAHSELYVSVINLCSGHAGCVLCPLK